MPASDENAEKPSQQRFEQALKNRLRDQEKQTSPFDLSPSEIREGVGTGRLETLTERLGLTQDTLTRVLGASERTLQRRRQRGRLSPAESDRFGRLARVYDLALRAFDDDRDEAAYWLTTPKRALDGDTPVEHLDTEPGTRAVTEMLVVIDQTIPA